VGLEAKADEELSLSREREREREREIRSQNKFVQKDRRCSWITVREVEHSYRGRVRWTIRPMQMHGRRRRSELVIC